MRCSRRKSFKSWIVLPTRPERAERHFPVGCGRCIRSIWLWRNRRCMPPPRIGRNTSNCCRSGVIATPSRSLRRVALAEAYVNYGWEARGYGYGDTVSKDGWSLFDKRAKRAKEILERASKLPTKCPEWYVAMQGVALAQNWSKDAKRRTVPASDCLRA